VEGPLKPKPFAVVRYPEAVRTATPVANGPVDKQRMDVYMSQIST